MTGSLRWERVVWSVNRCCRRRVLCVSHALRLLGMALMFVGVSVAFFGYLIPMIDDARAGKVHVAVRGRLTSFSWSQVALSSRAMARNSSAVIVRRPRSTSSMALEFVSFLVASRNAITSAGKHQKSPHTQRIAAPICWSAKGLSVVGVIDAMLAMWSIELPMS